MINKNDKIKLKITDMGIDGEGIGRYYETPDNGMTFFVKNAVIGDAVSAIVTKVKKGYGYAKVLEILTPSKNRVKPACAMAGRCGGCQIMQLSYKAQLEFKANKVRNNIERLGGIKCDNYLPILGMEGGEPLHFRNKMQFPVGRSKDGRVITGFYAGRTHYIIETNDCLVSPEINSRILKAFREYAEAEKLPTYDEETGRGLIRHVLIRNGFYTGQIMVCIVINGSDKDMDTGKLVTAITQVSMPEPWKVASISLNINREKTNVILGPKVVNLYGTAYIEEKIISSELEMKPLIFKINPLSFFQTNPFQTNRLYDTALSFAGLTGKEIVWDLYCGAGTISLFLAQKARKVYGVEIVPEAIEAARENAVRNGIENAEFYCGKSEEIFPEMVLGAGRLKAAEGLDNIKVSAMNKERQSSAAHETDINDGREYIPDLVVLDPPRKGCDAALIEAIRRVAPDRIVYVSCDSATLARDLKLLCDDEAAGSSYKLKTVRAVDMFPHTVHVETVCLLSNRKPDTKVKIDVDLEDYYRIKDSKKNQD